MRRFPRYEQEKILDAIERSLSDPRKGAAKLSGMDPMIYRLRVGEYRAFFLLDDTLKIMKITDVRRRTTQTYR